MEALRSSYELLGKDIGPEAPRVPDPIYYFGDKECFESDTYFKDNRIDKRAPVKLSFVWKDLKALGKPQLELVFERKRTGLRYLSLNGDSRTMIKLGTGFSTVFTREHTVVTLDYEKLKEGPDGLAIAQHEMGHADQRPVFEDVISVFLAKDPERVIDEVSYPYRGDEYIEPSEYLAFFEPKKRILEAVRAFREKNQKETDTEEDVDIFKISEDLFLGASGLSVSSESLRPRAVKIISDFIEPTLEKVAWERARQIIR